VEKCEEGVYQIELLYEKRIVITECNPVADDYMENKNVYSLERALLWIYEDRHHSVLACNDFCAVKSCIDYVRKFLKIPAILPDMPEDMMQRIASGAGVRSATFSSLRPTQNVDVRTLIVYDQNLSNTALFTQLKNDVERTQKSGFFTNHPGLIRAGIGITRQYGRIWTPAHLNRTELIALSRSIVRKVDKELELLSVNDPSSVLTFYSNNKVLINGKEITGAAKSAFLELLNCLITVNKTDSITVDRDFFKSLIKNATTLNVNTAVMCMCRNCGDVEMLCGACDNRLKAAIHENEIKICCDCSDEFTSGFICECGQKIEIIEPCSHINLIPSIELIGSIAEFVAAMHPNIPVSKYFIFLGLELHRMKPDRALKEKAVFLCNLRKWQTGAHLMSQDKADNVYFKKIKEKCSVGNYHPKKADYEECFRRRVTKELFDNGEMCLLRAFGIPIDILLDGIHCGGEQADIVYNDYLGDEAVKIGLHVKSHVSDKTAKGLGRSKSVIKELYTQVYYSLYKILKGEHDFDVLGIAIPNKVSPDVLTSMQKLVNEFSVYFMAVLQDDWKKIFAKNLEIGEWADHK
jgi:hypothetical protein